MDDQIGLDHFLERGAERGDEMGRQVRDEADRVGQDDDRAVRQPDPPQGRVEGREQHVLGKHGRAGQAVEQGRLAGIGVADDRHDRKRDLLALGAMQVAGAPHGFQLALQLDDLFLEDAPVGLDLGLARTTEEAGAAPLALEVGPAPDQPAALVVEVRQLDLQRAFPGARAAAENLQDDAGAVEDLGVELLFEIALLDRGERMVDHDKLAARLGHLFGDLGDLAGADQRRGLGICDIDDLGVDGIEVDGVGEAHRLVQPRLRRAGQAWPARAIVTVIAQRLREDGHENDRARRRGLRVAGIVRYCPELPGLGMVQSGFPAVVLAVEHLHGLAGHDRRDGMLVDKLRMPVAAQQHAKIVERGDHARELHAIDEEDRERVLVLANGVEKKILQILRTFRHFSCLSPFPCGVPA